MTHMEMDMQGSSRTDLYLTRRSQLDANRLYRRFAVLYRGQDWLAIDCDGYQCGFERLGCAQNRERVIKRRDGVLEIAKPRLSRSQECGRLLETETGDTTVCP
jgi:hypothetical protein